MGRSAVVALGVVLMVVVIVGVDILFLRHHGLIRLAVNVAIVLLFAAAYAVWGHRR